MVSLQVGLYQFPSAAKHECVGGDDRTSLEELLIDGSSEHLCYCLDDGVPISSAILYSNSD